VSDMKSGGDKVKRKDILSHTFEKYVAMVESFHGAAAPGVIIGGFMIDLAYQSLCRDTLYNVICETAKCLPDAVQLLTPCSIGNRWLKIVDVGRFALTFYDKNKGTGVRVYLDNRKTEQWPEIRAWYLKLKPKHMQDSKLLLSQIREAGTGLFGIEDIVVDLASVPKKSSSPIAICPSCNEAYRAADGAICPACKEGLLPYTSRAACWDSALQAATVP